MYLLYIITLIFLIYIVVNKDIVKEGFQIRLSDNKDTAEYKKSVKYPSLNYNINNKKYKLKNIDLKNRSNIKSLNYTKSVDNNDSLFKLYGEKSNDPNYKKMIIDLDVNYIDPNIEINEMCAPPGLCDVDKIKRLYNCGCPDKDDISKCDNKLNTLNKVRSNNTFSDFENNIVEGYDNFGDFNKPSNKVFYTDYGGGEKYIPCGKCGDGFERNSLGECKKKCWNCSTYVTNNKNQLLDVDEDTNNLINCGDCNMRKNCDMRKDCNYSNKNNNYNTYFNLDEYLN